MTHYEAPHEVRDAAKLQSMIDTLNAGGQLPPVVVCGSRAFTGSHRLEAWDVCGVQAETIEISGEDYKAALAKMGMDWETDEVRDYTDFCIALYKVTRNPAVKAAIKDQRG